MENKQIVKRIKQSPSVDIKQVQLFRDDLNYIESELKEELKARDFRIQLGEYEYSSVNEIPDDHRRVHEMTITADDPYVRIVLRRAIANISSSDSSLKTTGAINNIAERLGKRTRKVRYYFIRPLGILGGLLLFFVSPIATLESVPAEVRLILIAVTVLLLPFAGLATYQTFRSYSTISFERDKKNFFARNKDALIVNMVVAAFSSLLTFIITRLSINN